ncbi:hypothetical protein HYT25_04150 [Candidatus Pacearchaeota archaeon]|nr:hypothetical protein [Candidatus Pacearchaeota archaeon]
MNGINLKELAKKRGNGYRCLVEATIDHEICPEDPLTETLRKGAQGVAYDFWEYGYDRRMIAMVVEWEKGFGCVYIEKYVGKSNIIREPITEIKFVREFMPNEQVQVKNPLLERCKLTLEEYLEQQKQQF